MTEEITELYKVWRPLSFKEVFGQAEAVLQLKTHLADNSLPHNILLIGPSGCGKTTLARILKDKLGCHDAGFVEINAADSKGIDMVRDVNLQMNQGHLGGRLRVYIIDECFHKNTLVETDKGTRRISDCVPGGRVRNLSGWGTIEHVFCNKVLIDRLIRLEFDDGTVTYTTKEHEYLTSIGWVQAQKIESHVDILTDVCYPMCIGDNNEKRKTDQTMPVLQRGISTSRQVMQEGMLLKNMRIIPESKKQGARGIGGKDVPDVQSRIPGQGVQSKDLLQHVLFLCYEKPATQFQGKSLWRDSERENLGIAQGFCANGRGQGNSAKTLRKNEKGKPITRSERVGKDQKYKGTERDSSQMAGKAGGQRTNNCPGIRSVESLGVEWVGVQFSYPDNETQRMRIPDVLQGGFREQKSASSCGGRWERPFIEKGYLEGCKENTTARRVRLVRSEIFQRGRNESSFVGIVGDSDLHRGYVEFFDLQVSNNPSYFANGLPVHNCHKLTSDAQSGLLKMLEDTPKHVYFFLCTTDPAKLLATIKTRCKLIQLVAMTPVEMRKAVEDVLAKSGKAVASSKVVDKIVAAADGSARAAMVLLNTAVRMTGEESQLASIVMEATERQAFDLVKALLWEASDWAKIAGILKDLKEQAVDIEPLRRALIACAAGELLKGGKKGGWANLLIECFGKPFFDSGFPGLVSACFEVMQVRAKR